MEIITRNVEPIKIGFPTNSRIAEDCAPLREALEFEGDQGAFRSRFVPDAIFRTARVRDIARFVKAGIYGLGIIGDDTAIEMDLDELGDWPDFIPEQERFRSKNKLDSFRFDLCEQPVKFILFGTEEIRNRMNNPRPGQWPSGDIVTSYPNLAQKLLARGNRLEASWQTQCANIIKCTRSKFISDVDGQIESIVANRDIPGVIGGMDIVRTGETIRSYDLVPICSFLESRRGIWKTPRIAEEKTRQLNDVAGALRERLAPFLKDDSSSAGWGH